MERTEHYDWNDGWLFTPQFDPSLLEPDCSGLELEPVRLPHTVKSLPFNYCNENDYQMISGYRRVFTAPRSWEGRTLLLTIGAAAHDATVYCNGQRAGHHACGYTAFTVNLTGMVRLGEENVLAIRCDSRETLDIPPFGGQTEELTYGGLYRGVALEVKENAWLRDVFIQAGAEGDFRIYSAAEGETVGCTLEAEIRAPSGRRAVYTGELSLPITGSLNGVQPWSCEHPTLYTLTLRLIRPGTLGLPDRVLDQKVIRFGFRTIQFVAGGLYLNGARVELRGLARFQSYPYQGYAMPDSIQRLDAQALRKELGCNVVRCCCPPSPAFLDACDELGLLAYVEMPGRRHIGGPAWKAQALQNCREMVCQCRNHPSVFLWGVRVAGSADDDAFYKKTNEAARRLDPTRPTAGSRRLKKSHLFEDVYAYDDFSFGGAGPGCQPRAAVTPDLRKGYLISAFGGMMYPTKSFDPGAQRLSQTLRCAAVLNDAAAQQGVAGCVGWTMADYNTHPSYGSGDHVSYHGVMDLFRNEKLAAAVFASQKDPRVPLRYRIPGLPGSRLRGYARGLPRRMLGLHQRRRGADVPRAGLHRRVPARPPGPVRSPGPSPHPDRRFRGGAAGKIRGHRPQRGGAAGRLPQRPPAGPRRPFPSAAGPADPAAADPADERGHPEPAVPHLYRGAGRPCRPLPVRRHLERPGGTHHRAGTGAADPAGMHRPQRHPHRRSHLGLRRHRPARHRPERLPAALLQ